MSEAAKAAGRKIAAAFSHAVAELSPDERAEREAAAIEAVRRGGDDFSIMLDDDGYLELFWPPGVLLFTSQADELLGDTPLPAENVDLVDFEVPDTFPRSWRP